MSQQQLKTLAKQLPAVAESFLDSSADGAASEPTEAALLVALAQAAVSQLGALLDAQDESTQELRRELKRAGKAVSKLLPQVEQAVAKASTAAPSEKLSGAEEDEAADQGKPPQSGAALHLGQYQSSSFENDEKKSKFARLMGGAKKSHRVDHHDTMALSAAEEKLREREIVLEFEAARTHQGKKGLGAK
jgi:hypothetical protein